MRNPSAGGSKPSTAHKTPSGSTDPGQVDIKLPFLRICIDGTYEWMKLESTTDGISILTGDLDLGHVPDVRHCWPKEASWDQRFCIRADLASHAEDLKPPQLDPRVRGTYYVMVCKLKELGQHGAVQLSEAKVDVCGDAFIFKVLEKGRDVNGRAVFGQVPAEMISLGIARRMLREIIAKNWKGGIVPKAWVNLSGSDRHTRQESTSAGLYRR